MRLSTLSGCGARKTIRIAKDALVFRPLPRAHLAYSATGSARIAFPKPTSLGTLIQRQESTIPRSLVCLLTEMYTFAKWSVVLSCRKKLTSGGFPVFPVKKHILLLNISPCNNSRKMLLFIVEIVSNWRIFHEHQNHRDFPGGTGSAVRLL